jgi:nucleoside-diphosphate-sugar epimerase
MPTQTTLNAVLSHVDAHLPESRERLFELLRIPSISAQPAHAADLRATLADISKAAKLLGWSPRVAAAAGFRLAVRWHVSNRAWLQGIRT